MPSKKQFDDIDQIHQKEEPDIRFWLNEDLYIPIDENGCLKSSCAEGALGFVVQLRTYEGDGRLALKIPRLMGETHQENAYISDLMEKELEAVRVIQRGISRFDSDESKARDYGYQQSDNYSQEIISAQLFGRGGLFRGRIHSENGPAEAQKFHNAIILIHFEKGENPRICAVKQNGSEDDVLCFPEGVNCPVKNKKDLEQIQTAAKSIMKDLPWTQTVFVESSSEYHAIQKGGLGIFGAGDAIDKPPTGSTWYAAIPSVAYDWAPGTLQEAISLNKREWGIDKHFELIQRVTDALSSLHGKHMLHGDLRPANIAYKGDPKIPKNYIVSDYGSFCKEGPQGNSIDANMPSGATQLATAGTERHSVFYSSERRTGREQETADTVVIFSNPGATELLIVAGWRSDLINPISAMAREEVQTEALNALNNNSSTGDNKLSQGDRIQFRDFIFEVESSADEGNRQIFKCKKHSWKVYQGRIVVANKEGFPELSWFPIPRIIERRQWSAASDLYSLGAVFLYSVFCNATRYEKYDRSQTEEDFRVMLSYLESPPYFNSIWKDLETLRIVLEREIKANGSNQPLGKVIYRGLDNQSPEQNKDGESKTVAEKTLRVVNRMTGAVPGVGRIVSAFLVHGSGRQIQLRLGHFIFFIHFILCCLHRRSHFDKVEEDELLQETKEQVFCENRKEEPGNGAIQKASERLRKIQKLFGGDKLKELLFKETEILEFDLRPDTAIREELLGLKNQIASYQDRIMFYRQKNKELRDQSFIFPTGKARKNRKILIEFEKELMAELEETRRIASKPDIS